MSERVRREVFDTPFGDKYRTLDTFWDYNGPQFTIGIKRFQPVYIYFSGKEDVIN